MRYETDVVIDLPRERVVALVMDQRLCRCGKRNVSGAHFWTESMGSQGLERKS